MTKLGEVKLFVFDFDGVMTDNRVLVSETGEESVYCHRGDGHGIKLLRSAGVEMVILSTEENRVVSARANKLNLNCVQGVGDKLPRLKQLADDLNIKSKNIAYVGNDINDLQCMDWVGLAIAVNDAEPEICEVAEIITKKPGGQGAIREIARLYFAAEAE